MTEAALGLGMNARQMLFAGAVATGRPGDHRGHPHRRRCSWSGRATLATPVGCTTLGNYIFEGLEMNDQAVIVLGCVLAAVLAVAMDQLIRLLELAVRRRRTGARAWVASGGVPAARDDRRAVAADRPAVLSAAQPCRCRQRPVHRAAHPLRGARTQTLPAAARSPSTSAGAWASRSSSCRSATARSTAASTTRGTSGRL